MGTFDEPVSIRTDQEEIAGTFITPGTLVPGVLFVHGWGGSQEQYLARAREITALGCICLTFDLRGHAQTRLQYETVSRAANLADVLAAYDLLVQRRHVDKTSIAVVGSSYGGYLAAILTSMRPVRWLAMRALRCTRTRAGRARSANCTAIRTCPRIAAAWYRPRATVPCRPANLSRETCC